MTPDTKLTEHWTYTGDDDDGDSWVHSWTWLMYYFYILLMNCLKRLKYQLCNCQWKDRKVSDFIKENLALCPKMNKSLTALELHEVE